MPWLEDSVHRLCVCVICSPFPVWGAALPSLLFRIPGIGKGHPGPAVPNSQSQEQPPGPAEPFVVRVPSPQPPPRPCRGYCRVNICPPPPAVSNTIKVLI